MGPDGLNVSAMRRGLLAELAALTARARSKKVGPDDPAKDYGVRDSLSRAQRFVLEVFPGAQEEVRPCERGGMLKLRIFLPDADGMALGDREAEGYLDSESDELSRARVWLRAALVAHAVSVHRRSMGEGVSPAQRIERAVALLKREFPAAGLSFGYIGNLSAHSDDRAWSLSSRIKLGFGGRDQWSLPVDMLDEVVTADVLENASDSVRQALLMSDVKNGFCPAPEVASVWVWDAFSGAEQRVQWRAGMGTLSGWGVDFERDPFFVPTHWAPDGGGKPLGWRPFGVRHVLGMGSVCGSAVMCFQPSVSVLPGNTPLRSEGVVVGVLRSGEVEIFRVIHAESNRAFLCDLAKPLASSFVVPLHGECRQARFFVLNEVPGHLADGIELSVKRIRDRMVQKVSPGADLFFSEEFNREVSAMLKRCEARVSLLRVADQTPEEGIAP